MASRGLSTAEIIGGVFPAMIKEKASSIREAERGLLLAAVPDTRIELSCANQFEGPLGKTCM